MPLCVSASAVSALIICSLLSRASSVPVTAVDSTLSAFEESSTADITTTPPAAATTPFIYIDTWCMLVWCENDGTCVDLPEDPFYMCVCSPQWDGPTCQYPKTTAADFTTTPLPATTTPALYGDTWCMIYSCHNDGTCVDLPGDPYYMCVCSPQWGGPTCQYPKTTAADFTTTTLPATTTPVLYVDTWCMIYSCDNDGTCVDLPGDPYYMCVCSPQWGGPTCQYPKTTAADFTTTTLAATTTPIIYVDTWCMFYSCDNGGTCVDLPQDPNQHCLCSPQWEGPTCQYPVTTTTTTSFIPVDTWCTLFSCDNGGTCVDLPEEPFHQCLCRPGWEGSTCQCPSLCGIIRQLWPHPGRLHGKCTAQCVSGNAPAVIHKDKWCTRFSCDNGGTCMDLPQKPFHRCVCSPGWKGITCQHPSPLQ